MNLQKSFEILLELAFEEDLAQAGDVTSKAIFSGETTTARLVSRDSGVLAGAEYFTQVYKRIDPELSISFHRNDGDTLSEGDLVAEVQGKALSVMTGERIALNFLGYLSGIATVASKLSAAAEGKTKILDTRKTLPGYRYLAKWAVLQGGAYNHRMGLHDMVMIKDNHIDAAGGITKAVEKVRDRWGDAYRIEVECRTLDEVEEAVRCGADIIMLDNMDTDTAAKALSIGRPRGKDGIKFEASGDMDEDKIFRYKDLEVDYISVGRLTHSVVSFNFSLQIDSAETA